MWKKFILYPVGTLGGAFILHTVSEVMAEKYECRKWYNFFNMSVHCYLIKRASYLCEIGLQDWIVFTRKLWNI